MEIKGYKREIEITVISAEGLQVSRKQPVKKNAFIVIRSDPFTSRSTAMDTQGGSYPAWNQKLLLPLPATARFITVDAHSGNKLIGTANIPISDFSGGLLPQNYLSFLSYRLRDVNGAKNGIVNLSVKVMAAAGAGCSAHPCSGDNFSHHPIVTGIPVSYRQ